MEAKIVHILIHIARILVTAVNLCALVLVVGMVIRNSHS